MLQKGIKSDIRFFEKRIKSEYRKPEICFQSESIKKRRPPQKQRTAFFCPPVKLHKHSYRQVVPLILPEHSVPFFPVRFRLLIIYRKLPHKPFHFVGFVCKVKIHIPVETRFRNGNNRADELTDYVSVYIGKV